MRTDTERGSPIGVGMRREQTEEVGGHLDGQGMVGGSGGVSKWGRRSGRTFGRIGSSVQEAVDF